MKMVILFTPRRLSSYNATFTLSAKKIIIFHFTAWIPFWPGRVDLFQQHKRGGRWRTNTDNELQLTVILGNVFFKIKFGGEGKITNVCLKKTQKKHNDWFILWNLNGLIREVIRLREYGHARMYVLHLFELQSGIW